VSRRRYFAYRLRVLSANKTGLERRVEDRELRRLRRMIFTLPFLVTKMSPYYNR
jgi:hypothetical protein